MFKAFLPKAKTRRRKSRPTAAASMMSAMIGSGMRMTATVMRQAGKAAAKPVTPKAKPRSLAASRSRTIVAARASSFHAGVHDCDHGVLRYKIYVPASAANALAPLPLLVMLHGCGQTPDDFAKGTQMNALAEEFGILVLYPAQSRDAHPKRCWNWFRTTDQQRDSGEPALIASLTRQVLTLYPADPARVYVAGLSAGASAALILSEVHPDLFAAVGAHSGLPHGAARDQTTAMMAMGQGNPGTRRSAPMPTIIFHGSDDGMVNPRNGRLATIRAVEAFPALRSTDAKGRVAGGRSYVKTTHRIGQGRPFVEHWLIEGAGHAWSGGSRAGRFVDPSGPDASRAMLRFFLRHRTPAR